MTCVISHDASASRTAAAIDVGGLLRPARAHGTARADDLAELRARLVGDDHARLGAAAIDSDDDEGHARAGRRGRHGMRVVTRGCRRASVMEVPMRTYQGHAIAANGASVDASEG